VLPPLCGGLRAVAGAGAVNGYANYRAVCLGAEVQAAHCNGFVVTDAQANPLASSSPPAGAYGPTQFVPPTVFRRAAPRRPWQS
jgi:hypothetical protein